MAALPPSAETARTSRPSRSPGGSRERGQSAVFVLLFLGILLISLNYLYKQGRITSDKMEMQNAADAIAYSISLTEARDLNFAAYMNRAMIANEVAVGQLLGLASWGFLWESYGDFLNAYVRPLQEVPILNAVPAAVYSFTSVAFKVPGKAFIAVLGGLANLGTTMLHYINKFYGAAQFLYHTATAAFSIGTIHEMLQQNAPPGARISEYGIFSLITHFATYGSIPLPCPPCESAPESIADEFVPFVESYWPNSTVKRSDYDDGDKGDLEGYERFAAIIRDSRDPFTLNKSWELKPFEFMKPIIDPIPLLSVRDGNINFDLEFREEFFGGVAGAEFDLNFYFGISVARDGASELRMMVPATGDFKAGEIFNWSAADTNSLAAELGASVSIGVWADIGITVLRAGASAGIHFADEEMEVEDVVVSLGPFDIPVVPGFTTPFPTSAPFGAAFTEAGKTSPNNQKFTTMGNFDSPVPNDAYGSAANRTAAWNMVAIPPGAAFTGVPPGVMPPGVRMRSDVSAGTLYGDQKTRVNKKYGGLPQFIDTTGTDSTLWGFGGKNMTVSLVLDEDDHDLDRSQALVDTTTAGAHPEMGTEGTSMTYGDLRLTEQMANDQLHVMARSEVYFERPNDLDFYARLDGRTEHGSAFNPYWGARLTELRYIDSVAGLMAQQQQDFTGATELAGAAVSLFEDLMDLVKDISIGDFFPE